MSCRRPLAVLNSPHHQGYAADLHQVSPLSSKSLFKSPGNLCRRKARASPSPSPGPSKIPITPRTARAGQKSPTVAISQANVVQVSESIDVIGRLIEEVNVNKENLRRMRRQSTTPSRGTPSRSKVDKDYSSAHKQLDSRRELLSSALKRLKEQRHQMIASQLRAKNAEQATQRAKAEAAIQKARAERAEAKCRQSEKDLELMRNKLRLTEEMVAKLRETHWADLSQHVSGHVPNSEDEVGTFFVDMFKRAQDFAKEVFAEEQESRSPSASVKCAEKKSGSSQQESWQPWQPDPGDLIDFTSSPDLISGITEPPNRNPFPSGARGNAERDRDATAWRWNNGPAWGPVQGPYVARVPPMRGAIAPLRYPRR